MRDLGIDVLSVFGLPPVEFVKLTADLGCQHLSVTTFFLDYNPHGYRPYSLTADKALQREMLAAMADLNVSIFDAEGFFVFPGRDVREFAPELDAMCELGVPRLTTLSLDPDVGRSFDQLALLTELASSLGLEVVLELTPGLAVSTLETALAAVRHVGRENFKLLLDTMHWVRAGHGPQEAAALDPKLVSYCQLCDAPLQSAFDDYVEEVTNERLPPGEGELPLREILAALPRDTPVSLEIPRRSLAEAGVGPYERLKPCVDAARRLLAAID